MPWSKILGYFVKMLGQKFIKIRALCNLHPIKETYFMISVGGRGGEVPAVCGQGFPTQGEHVHAPVGSCTICIPRHAFQIVLREYASPSSMKNNKGSASLRPWHLPWEAQMGLKGLLEPDSCINRMISALFPNFLVKR